MGPSPSKQGSSTDTAPSPDGGSTASPTRSLYRRMQDKKRGPISDEDIKKYTGMTRDELNGWAKDRPGVGGNRLAGTLAVGNASGLGGAAAGAGLGGWGPGAEPRGPDRGLKFPPAPGSGAKETEPGR